MRVALQGCPAPVFRSERGEELDLLSLKARLAGSALRPSRAWTSCRVMTEALAAIAVSLSNRSAVSGAVFALKAFGLDQPEELLDCPAFLVPSNDPPGRGGVGDLVGRRKAPIRRLGAGRRKILDDLDQGQIDALGQGGRRALRSLDRHASKARRKLGLTGRPMGASRKSIVVTSAMGEAAPVAKGSRHRSGRGDASNTSEDESSAPQPKPIRRKCRLRDRRLR